MAGWDPGRDPGWGGDKPLTRETASPPREHRRWRMGGQMDSHDVRNRFRPTCLAQGQRTAAFLPLLGACLAGDTTKEGQASSLGPNGQDTAGDGETPLTQVPVESSCCQEPVPESTAPGKMGFFSLTSEAALPS